MDRYNLIIIGFIAAAVFVTLWWTFNTIRRIDNQKNFCAVQLTSVAKLWRKAKFVPEDAKERESLYLYRDFLRKFDDDEGQYPVMVKDGKVRCMTRKEYDNLFGQKDILPVSVLVSVLSIILLIGSLGVNIFLTKTPLVGVGLALIMPMLQIVLAVFISRFNKDKNSYRDGIFLALKENSVAFLSITKPFIIVDAYPEKFGKNKKPLYPTVGVLPKEQTKEVCDFIIRQKAAETKVVLSDVDNDQEINRLSKKVFKKNINHENISVSEKNADEVTKTQEQTTTAEKVSTEEAKSEKAPQPSEKKSYKVKLLDKLTNNMVDAEIKRAILIAKKEEQKRQVAEQAVAIETKSAPRKPVQEVKAPAEDDFSLEAIGQALDAEIARRNKRN